MRNLVVDIGNTNHKLAVFDGREMLTFLRVRDLSPDQLADLISEYKVEGSTLSTVTKSSHSLISFLKEKTFYYEFSTAINPGIKNHYASPQTLGLDRWAKVLAAFRCYPNENCFMIDAGTCITYDFINDTGNYLGGSISPGIGMRFSALNHYTGRLPLLEWDGTHQNIPDGLDTVSAIQNGVLLGVVHEVIGNISKIKEAKERLKVLLTGGDASFLLEQLKNSIFAPQIIHDPYLVLRGLNEVIAFEHVQKN